MRNVFTYSMPYSLSPSFDLRTLVEVERKKENGLFKSDKREKVKELTIIDSLWDSLTPIQYLISGEWLRQWSFYIFEDGDSPDSINNSSLIYSFSSQYQLATVVLKSSLIQGIDYYIINARVWNYFYNSYGCDVCLKLSPSAIKRMPSYSNKDTEIEVNNEGDLMLYPLVQENNNEHVCVSIDNDKIFANSIDDVFNGFDRSSISTIHPCVLCGNDSLFCCKRCHRCYYCSIECYSIHYPYHQQDCSRTSLSNSNQSEQMRNGIINTGNTCYLASSLQCLYSVKPFRQLLLSNHFEQYLMIDKRSPNCLTTSLSHVFRDLCFNQYSIHAGQIRSSLFRYNNEISLWGQEDAHETITMILDIVLEETNVLKQRKGTSDKTFLPSLHSESKNPWTSYTQEILSPFTPIFSFLVKRTSTCSSCNNQVCSHQAYTSLSLPLPLHNVMIVSVILYSPIFLNTSTVIYPSPRQFTLQLHKDITIQDLQILLSQSDALHFPPSFYSIQSSQKSNLSDDWINGMLTKGTNLICRVIPSSLQNCIDCSDFIHSSFYKEEETEEELDRNNSCHWLLCTIIQDKKTKKIPRTIFIESLNLIVNDFLNQLHSLYHHIQSICLEGENGKDRVDLTTCNENELLWHLIRPSHRYLVITIQSGIKIETATSSIQSLSSSIIPISFLQLLSSLNKKSSIHQKLLIDPVIPDESRLLPDKLLSIEDCLHCYFKREVMDFSAEYTCEKCNRVVEVMRDSTMEHAPYVLILHLMRFAFDNFHSIKLSDNVQYPLHDLDCSEYFNLPKGSIVYDLIAVINHLGYTEGGHYIAYINMSDHPEDESIFNWKCYNDSSISSLSKNQVEQNPNAYILFYQLRNLKLLVYKCFLSTNII